MNYKRQTMNIENPEALYDSGFYIHRNISR